jgi:hypothetical protein
MSSGDSKRNRADPAHSGVSNRFTRATGRAPGAARSMI